MGVLYDLRTKIDKAIEDKGLDASVVRGKIGLQTGFLLSLVSPSTPDDPVRIEKLRKAVEAILQMKL